MRTSGHPALHRRAFLRRAGRGLPALVLALFAAGVRGRPAPSAQSVWEAGAYTFSDELGGFRITGASGTGTKDDPIVITEELNSATPVTLVIRTTKPIQPFDTAGAFANGFLHMRIEVLNNSGLPWVEFEFELQEKLAQPSVFGDGLSFDQRRTDSGNISSDSFPEYSRDFEPYDRLLFKTARSTR